MLKQGTRIKVLTKGNAEDLQLFGRLVSLGDDFLVIRASTNDERHNIHIPMRNVLLITEVE